MKKLLLITFLNLLFLSTFGQLPYTWSGVDPGWVSVGDGSRDLIWRAGCASVTTNCAGNYNNNELTTYTSPTIDASCSNASTINITFTASGNAEYLYDFLFIEYSLNNGTTWINPYGAGVGWTGNFGTGYTIPVVTVPTSSTFRFRFTFQSDFIFTYSGYRITDFDIWCNVILPIELIEFDVTKSKDGNILNWTTMSEINNDYFSLERSKDGIIWEEIQIIDGSGNTNNMTTYEFIDNEYENVINYYRLSQIDFNGNYTTSNIISVDNRKSENDIVSITNLLGQKVNDDYKGIIIVYYSDNTYEKIMRY